jgi:hypothetical protein
VNGRVSEQASVKQIDETMLQKHTLQIKKYANWKGKN